MRTKKDASRLPEGFVDDVSNIPLQNRISFVPINDAVDDDACGTGNEASDSDLGDSPPEERWKRYVTSNETTTSDIVGNSRLQWRNIYF
ncbi:hypothetical protein E3N88_06689 [Mikania micrantha]|uniref:Uncharacterized protein n=1 Tax=Mikania micrantha TaxID=192012 RepID=A0A5N6PPF2_9ASTR|nr:hypothetical protein E3N88_06689 [Mikania micrantha]